MSDFFKTVKQSCSKLANKTNTKYKQKNEQILICRALMQETDIDFVHYIEILWQKEAQTENNNNYKKRGKESYTIKPQYIYKLLTYRHIVALSDTSKCATPGFV